MPNRVGSDIIDAPVRSSVFVQGTNAMKPRILGSYFGTLFLVLIIGVPVDVVFNLRSIQQHGYEELILVIGRGVVQGFSLSIPLYAAFRARVPKRDSK
jgi:hypothetical protein